MNAVLQKALDQPKCPDIAFVSNIRTIDGVTNGFLMALKNIEFQTAGVHFNTSTTKKSRQDNSFTFRAIA